MLQIYQRFSSMLQSSYKVAHSFIENTSTVCTETIKFWNVADNTLTQFENDMRKYADTTNVNFEEKKISNKDINYFLENHIYI